MRLPSRSLPAFARLLSRVPLPSPTLPHTRPSLRASAPRRTMTGGPGSGAAPFALGSPPRALSQLPATSVWLEMTPLAGLVGAVNLGQGFPDWAPPSFLTDAAAATRDAGAVHQYARSMGDPALVRAAADEYGPRLRPRGAVDPMRNVLVTAGASHGLSVAIGALAGPGDEVVLVEPAFDVYAGAVKVAGAKPVFVSMKFPGGEAKSARELVLDVDELRACFNERTRLLVLNSPHNPTGKVFSRAELEAIKSALNPFPHIAVISDEVYEHMVYDPELPHVPFASLSEDAFNRTVSIYSIGKTFTATGWKIGWAVGPEPIIARMQTLNQYSVFSVASTLQRAVSSALRTARDSYQGYPTYYAWLISEYKRKRDEFVAVVDSVPGLTAIVPDGAFYVMARHSAPGAADGKLKQIPPEVEQFLADGKLRIDPATAGRADYNFCRRLAVDKKVVAIPPSAFYSEEHASEDLAANFARFAFCKVDEVLAEGKRRLCD